MNQLDNNFEDLLLQPETLSKLSSNFGLQPQQTTEAIQLVIPSLLEALSNNVQQPQGAAALQQALQKDHDGSILDQLPELINNPALGSGSGILKHVLGGNSSPLAQDISQKTGINADAIMSIMTIVAPIILGKLGQQQRQSNGNENALIEILSAATQAQQQKNPAASIALNLLSRFLNKGQGQSSTPDSNQDIINAGINILGKMFGK